MTTLPMEQEKSTAVETATEQKSSGLETQTLPTVDPSQSKDVQAEKVSADSDFLASLEEEEKQEVSQAVTVEQAVQEIEDLRTAGMLSDVLAESLRLKLTEDGTGLMARLAPEDAMATVEQIKKLQEAGLSADAIKAAATIGFGRGGAAGIRNYLAEIDGKDEKAFIDYAQTSSKGTLLWLHENTELLDESTKKLLNVEALAEAERARYLSKTIKGSDYNQYFKSGGPDASHYLKNKNLDGWEGMLSFIAAGEALEEDPYNSMNQGTRNNTIVGMGISQDVIGQKLTDLTIGQVMELQRQDKVFAAGRYQIIDTTMPIALKSSGLSKNDKFSPENQDKLAIALILNKQPELGAFLKGNSSDLNGAIVAFAREWASVPVPEDMTTHDGRFVRAGESYYGGANHEQHSVAEVKQMVLAARDSLKKRLS